MGELAAWLNKDNLTIEQSPISPEQLAGLLKRIKDRTISGKIAKTLFVALCQGEGDSADQLIAEQDLQQVTDQGAIEQLIDQVLTANPKQLDQYRSGKDKLFGFFVGQVMKASQGKANPAQVNQLLRDKLNHSA
jgi:aspartyl-tRNA(Asn)/glutamyl-tRNA(Gln) amidotransferase subunit B